MIGKKGCDPMLIDWVGEPSKASLSSTHSPFPFPRFGAGSLWNEEGRYLLSATGQRGFLMANKDREVGKI
jgi:hypothetical protein